MEALNFLKMDPIVNWLDYFLERTKLSELLTQSESNRETLYKLADQFMEQAMLGEAEEAQMRKDELRMLTEKEDLDFLQHKIAEQWMCALSCVAALDWDLKLLFETSNPRRIQALFDRLLFWAFQSSSEANFDVICLPSDNTFTSLQVFAAWIYARFILMVDINGRLPAPRARPTVSNPLNMLDASLARADEIARSVAAMREKMPSTVRLLQSLLNQTGDSVQIPSEECFNVSAEPIQDPSVVVLERLPQPNFNTKNADLDMISFTVITQHALMKAHFAAGHLATAKALLLKVRSGLKSVADPSKLDPHMDLAELEFYEVAFGLRPPNVPNKPVVHDIRTLCTDLGDFNAECAVVRVRSGAFSAERLLDHLHDAGKQKLFVAEMEKLYVATVNPTQKAYIRAALYFACAFKATISDLLASSPIFKGFSWRKLASRIQVSIPPLPPNASIQSLSASGPPIWNVLTTFDLAVLKTSYAEMGDRLQYPFRMTFSDVISKPILDFRELQNYNQVLVLLGKLQQLANTNNSTKWKVFINALGAEIQPVLARRPEVGLLLAYEAIHVEMDMWNRRLCRADDPDAFKLATQTSLARVKSTVQNPAGTQEFLQFASSLCSFLINNGEWELIIKSNSMTNLKSMYADISRVLAVHVIASSARDRVIQAMAAWDKIIHPTLQDATKRASLGSRAVNPLISKADLLDFLVLLKEPKTVSFVLYYAATVYNIVLMAQGTHEDERHRVDKRIFLSQSDVWMVKDSEANTEMIDLPYVERLLDILCANSIEVNPVDTWWMRTRADFYFATGRYAEAGSTYAELALSQEKDITTGLESNVVDDTMWSKWAACCAALRFPTLAVLIGQLRKNLAPHLLKVETFLLDTPNTFDAGHAYFPMIADFSLMEFMATIYEKHGMQTYLQQLLKSVPTRRINMNASPSILLEETRRRKARFLRVLCMHFFENV